MSDKIEQYEKTIEALIEENAALTEAVENIARKQMRDREENTIYFGAEGEDGTILIESESLDEVLEVCNNSSGKYRPMTYTRSPWKYISFASHDDTEGF